MLTLATTAGLPLSINDTGDDLAYGAEVTCDKCREIPLQEIIPSLLNKYIFSPMRVYKQYHNLRMVEDVSAWQPSLHYDVLCIPSGLLGIEFIRSHIFYSNANFTAASIIQVLKGEVKILLQRNQNTRDVFKYVDEGIVICASEGDKVILPTNYYYTFINSTDQAVVIAKVQSQEHVADYVSMKKENGIAYNVISKNAGWVVVKNSRYRQVPDIREMSVYDLNHKYGNGLNPDTTLYQDAKCGTDLVRFFS